MENVKVAVVVKSQRAFVLEITIISQLSSKVLLTNSNNYVFIVLIQDM